MWLKEQSFPFEFIQFLPCSLWIKDVKPGNRSDLYLLLLHLLLIGYEQYLDLFLSINLP